MTAQRRFTCMALVLPLLFSMGVSALPSNYRSSSMPEIPPDVPQPEPGQTGSPFAIFKLYKFEDWNFRAHKSVSFTIEHEDLNGYRYQTREPIVQICWGQAQTPDADGQALSHHTCGRLYPQTEITFYEGTHWTEPAFVRGEGNLLAFHNYGMENWGHVGGIPKGYEERFLSFSWHNPVAVFQLSVSIVNEFGFVLETFFSPTYPMRMNCSTRGFAKLTNSGVSMCRNEDMKWDPAEY